MNELLLGCIADDFTGASDLASFLVNEGVSTLLLNGIPDTDDIGESADAIVIALKTRTLERSAAVAESLAALDWLRKRHAEKIYLKYCSTFDSTREGNIGPIADRVLEILDVPFTLLCPSLPANGRTVKDGHLYVNGIPLHESSMKDHPLTPMWDSDLSHLMDAQSRYLSHVLPAQDMSGSRAEVLDKVLDLGKGQAHFYIIPDFEVSWHGEKIIDIFGDLPVLTGGSGLMEALGKALVDRKGAKSQNPVKGTRGPGIILAGSCSIATLSQIDNFLVCNKGPALKLDPSKVMEGEMGLKEVTEFIRENRGRDILVYSSESIEKVRKAQDYGSGEVSEKLEALMSMAAEAALLQGYTRIIVAGGETSGAVTRRLGFNRYRIGESIAPGVPIMVPAENPLIRLVLKSGNFGDETFFTKALEKTRRESKWMTS